MSDNGHRPAQIRTDVIQSATNGVMHAVAVMGASPAERASVAKTVYVTLMLDLVHRHPDVLADCRMAFASMGALVDAMAACESVDSLTALLVMKSNEDTFIHTAAPVVG